MSGFTVRLAIQRHASPRELASSLFDRATRGGIPAGRVAAGGVGCIV